jgi:cyanate permease
MITLVGNYFGVKSYAQIMGLLILTGTVLAALSPVLAGIAYDKYGSYEIAFQAAMAIALLGTLIMPFAAPPGPASVEKT